MDVEWAASKLRDYVRVFEQAKSDVSGVRLADNESYLNRRLPTLVRICEAVDEDTIQDRDEFLTGDPPTAMFPYWSFIYDCANRALGILEDWREIDLALRPEAPGLYADKFHEWVWESARPSWESGLYRASVHHAASSVNEQLQRKIGRNDVSDDKLIQQVFGEKGPSAGQKKLRVPGDPTAQTAQSIQRGALQLGLSAFWFVRNPAAHSTEEWSRQHALECLALLSQLARIVDDSEVVEVDSG